MRNLEAHATPSDETADVCGHPQLIEIYSYMTGHLGAGEIGNIFTNDVGTDRDAITGLRAPTHVRPFSLSAIVLRLWLTEPL